jgi:ABC-type multidrug transport system fused ATPase/permease subunit
MDGDRLRELVNDIRLAMPKEMKRAQTIDYDCDRIMKEAQANAESIIHGAEERAKALVAENAIVEEAKRRAEEEAIRKAKKAEEERIRKEKEAEEAKRRAEEEAILKAKKAEEERIRKAKVAEEAKRKAEEEAIRKAKKAEEERIRKLKEAEEEALSKRERKIWGISFFTGLIAGVWSYIAALEFLGWIYSIFVFILIALGVLAGMVAVISNDKKQWKNILFRSIFAVVTIGLIILSITSGTFSISNLFLSIFAGFFCVGACSVFAKPSAWND